MEVPLHLQNIKFLSLFLAPFVSSFIAFSHAQGAPESSETDGHEKTALATHQNWLCSSFSFGSVKNEGSSLKNEIELKLRYIRDFGYFGLGMGISFDETGVGSSTERSTSTELLAKINFVENQPGTRIVPHLIFGIGDSLTNIISDSGLIASSEFKSNFMSVGLAVDIFPFNSTTAITPGFYFLKQKTDSGFESTRQSLALGFAFVY